MTMMRYRTLPALDVSISEIGFGGAALSGEGGGYGFGAIQEQDAIQLVEKVLDAGINLLDTAPIYGFGLSEQRIGKALKGQRERAVLVSKSGVTWDSANRVGIDNSASTTRRMLEQSLRDLQTEFIDIYFVHWPDPQIDIRFTMEVLAEAKEQGKIRAIGLSNTFPEELKRAQEVAAVDILQGEFNVFQPYPKDVLFAQAKAQNIGFLSWGTLDKGILTGRVDPAREADSNFDSTDVRAHAVWWTKADRAPKYRAMAEIKPLLQRYSCTGLALAVGYVLSHTEVTSALCGVRNPNQLDSLMLAAASTPPPELLEEVVAIVKKIMPTP